MNGFSRVTVYSGKLILLLLLSSCFSFVSTFAQNASLQPDKIQDSTGFYRLENIENYIEKDSLDKAEKLLDENENFAQKKGDDFLISENSFVKAKLYYEKGDFNESLLLFQQVLKFSEIAKDTTLIIKSLSALSKLYNELGFADSAFMYCNREMILNKAIKSYTGVSNNFRRLYMFPRYTLGGLAESQFVTKGYLDSSLVYAKKSKNLSTIVYAMTNFAVRTYVDDPKKGLRLIQAAIDSARKIPPPSSALAYALLQSYHNFWKAGKHVEAEENLLEALPIAQSFNKPSQLAQVYWLLGTIENSKKNNDKALSYLRKAVYYCEKENISPLKRSVYTVIREVHRELGNVDSTLYYLEKYAVLAEQAHNSAMIKQVSLLSAKFKVAEKEDKIKLLDALNIQKEEQIYLQNMFILTLVTSVTIVIVLLGFLFFQYKKTQKAYLVLTRKTTEIKDQQKEIVRLNGEKRANLKNKLEPLKIKLADLFEKHKLHLNKDISLQSVASKLGTNTSYLSTLINSSYNCNFTQFLHKYRVLEACEILSNEENEIYTMEGIAEMSGFISKSAFNKAFKESTGLTPSTFRKNIKANEV